MGAESRCKNKYVIAAILIVVLFVVQFLFSRFGSLISQLFDYSSFDPDGLFAQVSVHHIIQMLCALTLIFIIWKAKKTEWFNIRPRLDSKGIKDTLLFCLAITVYYLAVYIIGSFTNTISTYDYELNAVNVSGTLGFQLLLSGPSEEILFRGVILGRLKRVMPVWSAVIVSSLAFALVHGNPLWIAYTFVMGLLVAMIDVKYDSIVPGMIMHFMFNLYGCGICFK